MHDDRELTIATGRSRRETEWTRKTVTWGALALINEQSNIIEKYHKADSFLFAHGWRWTDD